MSPSSRRAPDPAPDASPLFGGTIEAALFGLVMIALAGVALWFDLEVNRVFDVPKALALKTIGGGTALVWLGMALFGPGVRWRSARVFAAPVFVLLFAVGLSTLFSLDVPTSLYGVYERQFGFQGFLACVGIYFVVATTVAGRRGAILGLALVALLGAMLGAYTFMQSQGHDPWPFFRSPHNKVYGFLGNATFAGNALALIFPISAMTALVGAAETGSRAKPVGPWLLAFLGGFFGLAVLLVVPGYVLGGRLDASAPGTGAQSALRFGFAAGTLLLLGALGLGSHGPGWCRLDDPRQRRAADAVAAGALVAAVVLIGVGLFFTRTRGAWGGSGIAIIAGFILLPWLFKDQPARFRRVAAGSWSALLLISIAFIVFVTQSDSLAARTIRSVPAAFDPDRTDFGKGQGTRIYLWSESFRVLTDHEETLERLHDDQVDRARRVRGPLVEESPFRTTEPPDPPTYGPLRKVGVWLFGIGIETYRYAFMSHKSKRLEELDPMTNHDNPHNNYLYVLASFGILGLLAYLWLLFSLLRKASLRFMDAERPRWERGLAFGVVTSFFSYAVYSIAGFDSVACSVFFYVVLGLAAVLFEPNASEKRAPLSHWILSDLRPSLATRPGARAGVAGALALVVGGLLLHTAVSGARIYQAEQVFTGRSRGGRPTVDERIAELERAIRLHPFEESYYKQTLGSTHAQAASRALSQARRLQSMAVQARGQDPAQAQQLLRRAEAAKLKAERHTEEAELALYAALDHAWAPENIFISLFQALYAVGEVREAEQALERALEHSPHLGAVRANLAALQAARGARDEALANCRWVLEVDRKNAMAYRTCGQVHLERGELEEAARMLARAERLRPDDRLTQRYLDELARARKAAAGTAPTSATATTR